MAARRVVTLVVSGVAVLIVKIQNILLNRKKMMWLELKGNNTR